MDEMSYTITGHINHRPADVLRVDGVGSTLTLPTTMSPQRRHSGGAITRVILINSMLHAAVSDA